MTELTVLYWFLGLLVLFVVIGALVPKYLPSLVRYIDETVLKEERHDHPSGGSF